MNKLAKYGSVVTIITLMLGIGTVKAQTTIEGVDYVRSGPGESVTAPFIPAAPGSGPPDEPGADAVVTTGLYSGFIELSVSGTGESYATRLNDAFWVFTDLAQDPLTTPYNDSIWYQLNVSTQTLLGLYDAGFDTTDTPPAQLAKHKIVYDLDADTEVSPEYVPAYRSDHTYSIVVDLGTDVLSQVHFGVADGQFSDNSGAYTIMLYQLGISVAIDIKTESCPNPIRLKSKGVLAVAILGTEDFDVTQVDPATVKMNREGIEYGVSPLRWAYEDVATPFDGELCDCHDLGPDGFLDLTLKFDVPELVEDLELDDVIGETIPLTLTGNLLEEFDGAPILGEDCVIVLE